MSVCGHEPTVADDRFPAFRYGIDGSKRRAAVGSRAPSADCRVLKVPQRGPAPM